MRISVRARGEYQVVCDQVELPGIGVAAALDHPRQTRRRAFSVEARRSAVPRIAPLQSQGAAVKDFLKTAACSGVRFDL